MQPAEVAHAVLARRQAQVSRPKPPAAAGVGPRQGVPSSFIRRRRFRAGIGAQPSISPSARAPGASHSKPRSHSTPHP
jgi:hypothetical protein